MERVLKEAAVEPGAVKYQVLATLAATAASILAIPLIPVVAPFAHWYWSRYYDNLRVILTTRELKVHRGVLVREEKSIPLEKITDLAVFQGPIMRWLGLKGIKVETAGQSGGGGALVKIIGLAETDAFRDRVLAQRDRITDRDDDTRQAIPAAPPTVLPLGAGSDAALLEAANDIRETLRRIEAALTRD